ncbi:MAG TPA: amidohydrolase family protein, partial [Isosphaeraceae bacterium]|nr:amidohydrolase family protein [Isosphaeraceae bacterium]
MSETSEKTWTLTARWIIPVDGPPLKQGTITISGDRIVAVEPHGQRSADQDLGNVAILPGFVNAHTHLDLSGLRGKCPPRPDFTEWLRGVIRHRRTQTPEQIECDIREGLRESLVSGTTLLGDITAGGASWSILSQAPIRSVVFHELLGLPADRVAPVTKLATDWLLFHEASATCRPGLSPHAPYSTSQAIFEMVGKLAEEYRVPLATHLAETTWE